MKFVLMERIITPDDALTNEQIESVTKKKIGSYFSDISPNIGDVLFFIDNVYYQIISIIRKIEQSEKHVDQSFLLEPDNSSCFEEVVILEVIVSSEVYFNIYSGKEETFPVITELAESENV